MAGLGWLSCSVGTAPSSVIPLPENHSDKPSTRAERVLQKQVGNSRPATPAPLTALSRPLQVLHHGVVVDPAQDLLLHQAKLFSRGQLPLARVAREARQMVGVAPGAAHPVAGVDLPAAAGALSTEPTVRGTETGGLQRTEDRGHHGRAKKGLEEENFGRGRRAAAS